MPTYEYRCDQGHNFEVMRRMSDEPVTSCDVCGASVKRVFSPVAVHFKGTGFYSTDYGSKNRARELKESADANGKNGKDGASSSDSSGSSGSDSSSSDSSSATKPDAAPAKTETKAPAAH